jgi:hypothetical protein
MDSIGFPPHESNGWRPFLAPGRLEIRFVESSHLSMMAVASAAETARRIAEGLEWLHSKAQHNPGKVLVAIIELLNLIEVICCRAKGPI